MTDRSTPVPTGRRWRKTRWLLLPAIAAIAIFAAAIYWGKRELREAMAAASRDDPYWQLHDMEAHRAAVPTDENSVLFLQVGKKRTGAIKSNLIWDNDFDELTNYPASRSNEQQKESLGNLIQPYAVALVEYRKLKDYPRGRALLTFAPDVISTLLPHVQDARDAAMALRYDAFQQLETDNTAGAADAIIAQFHAARSIGDEPFLISALVRIACDAMAATTCERFLAQCKADDPTLARIQKTVETTLADPIFLNGIRGERAMGFAALEHIRSQPWAAAGLGPGLAGGSTSIWDQVQAFIPGMVQRNQAAALTAMNEAVAIARRPHEEHWDAFETWETKIKNMPALARLLAPAVTKVSQASLRHQAQLRCLHVALAAERYRLKHSKWPDSLMELVAEKLIDSTPLDPFDGKPLRIKRVEDGLLIYSVGRDRKDDGGKFDRKQSWQANHDLVFQLFDIDKRRQPPRPPRLKEPEPAEATSPP